jgi:hypothetical protein
MLDTILIGSGIATATTLIFIGLFIRFGRGWNGDLGTGINKRRR